MHEDILAAVSRLDEAETLGGVEPLDRTCRHLSLLGSVVEPYTEHARPARSLQRSATTLGIWELARGASPCPQGPGSSPRRSQVRKSQGRIWEPNDPKSS